MRSSQAPFLAFRKGCAHYEVAAIKPGENVGIFKKKQVYFAKPKSHLPIDLIKTKLYCKFFFKTFLQVPVNGCCE